MHLAAESHVDRSITGRRRLRRRRTSSGPSTCSKRRAPIGRTLAAHDKACFRFLHVSTDEVYGSLGDDGLFTENTPYDPSSPYSASKASSDHLAKAWQRTYGLPVIVSNCSNNYGPYHFPEKLIPLTILNALAGEPLPVYGEGENVRDWLYVEDHARALDTDRSSVAASARPTMSAAATSGATSTSSAASATCSIDFARPTARAKS